MYLFFWLGDSQGACEDMDSVLASAACALCVLLGVRWRARRTEFQTSASLSPITGREEGKDAIGIGGGVRVVLKHFPGYQPRGGVGAVLKHLPG